MAAALHPQFHPFPGTWIPIQSHLGPLPPHREHQKANNAFSLYWDSDHWDIPRGQSLFQHIPTSTPRAVRLSRVAAASRTPWITTGIPPAAPGRNKTHSTLIYWLPSPHPILGKEPIGQLWGIVPELPFVKSLGIHR